MKRFVCVCLVAALLICLTPAMVLKAQTDSLPTYENSLTVTVVTGQARSFSPADFPQVATCQRVIIMEKTALPQGEFAYSLVLVLSVDEFEQVKMAIEAVKDNPMVQTANVNRYAYDYDEKASYVEIVPHQAFLAVGETMDLTVDDSAWFSQAGLYACGIAFTVDPAIFTPENIREYSFEPFGLDKVYGLTEPLKKTSLGFSDTPLDESLAGVASPINQYFWKCGTREALSLGQYLTLLAAHNGILSAYVVYDILPTGVPIYDVWESLHKDLLTIEYADHQPLQPDRRITGDVITVFGRASGQATVQLTREYTFDKTATCQITVYRLGDINKDDSVTATDALRVLQAAVNIFPIQKGTETYLAADFNRDQVLNAVDALGMLKLAVSSPRNPNETITWVSEKYFPDPLLRQWVSQYDTNGDGTLTWAEVEPVEYMDLEQLFDKEEAITDATGLEYFENLTYLNLKGHKLTRLDTTSFKKLKHLNLQYNNIRSLDVSHNTKLEYLNVNTNAIESLDVTGCANLKTLEALYSNFETVDLSGNPRLQELRLWSGQRLNRLDLSQNKELEILSVFDNRLTALDVSQNPNLTVLSCGDNPLKELDISHNPLLTSVQCQETEITRLDTSNNPRLVYLDCVDAPVEELNLQANPNLHTLRCKGTALSQLDVSKNPNLQVLWCEQTDITRLDLTYNPNVTVTCDEGVEILR